MRFLRPNWQVLYRTTSSTFGKAIDFITRPEVITAITVTGLVVEICAHLASLRRSTRRAGFDPSRVE